MASLEQRIKSIENKLFDIETKIDELASCIQESETNTDTKIHNAILEIRKELEDIRD